MTSDQIKLKSDSKLVFSFPGLEDLVVRTGAESIKWSYDLNTKVQSTYGGQVVQILSVYTGPITIQGRTANNEELRKIYTWFTKYMTRAGYQRRNERAVLFKYPERGWSFYLQVTNLPKFRYAFNEIAIPWQITAEITSDRGENLFGELTMASLTESLTHEYLQKIERNLKYSVQGAEADIEQRGKNLSDNFQSLLGAYSLGEYDHTNIDLFSSISDNNLRQADEYWTEIFGTNELTSGGSNSSNSPITVGDNPTGDVGVGALIKEVFEAKDIPARLGIAVSIVESGLNPDARQPNGDFAVGLFQTFPRGAGGSRSHSQQLKQAFDNRSSKVTEHYTARMQTEAASEWFDAARPSSSTNPNDEEKMAQWAQRAQRAGIAYDSGQGRTKFRAAWKKAGEVLADVKKGGTALAISGTTRQLIDKLINHKNITFTRQMKSDISNGICTDPAMRGILSIAENYKLGVVSLFRADSITDSGYPSLHGKDGRCRAIDIGVINGLNVLSNPSVASPLQAFVLNNNNILRYHELIGPDEQKNGFRGKSPHTYSRSLLNQHKDHVHVGFLD